jgi:hypothetical protein
MMLQGHFVDTLINPIYRNLQNPIYATWNYFRGITAPTFYTITGLVFCYLLFKAKEKGDTKQRIKKGLSRGLMLIVVGYTLRISFIDWLFGYFDPYFLVIDVLQCIGLSLILIIGFYLLCGKNNTILGIVFSIIGTIIFLTEPLYRTISFPELPLIFSNYLSKTNGSIFTMIPWFGYVAYGGLIAVLMHKFQTKKHFRIITSMLFLVIGLLLIFASTPFLRQLTEWTDITIFKRSGDYNYLFSRLGNVLVIFGLFFGFEPYLKQSIISKIGQKTLSIYIIHFMIIYGSYTGFGLNRFFYKSLNPTEVVIGAILFIIVVCFISFYYVKTNKFVYNYLGKLVGLFKKSSTTDED